MTSELERRFNQEGMKRLINLENIILEAVEGKCWEVGHLKDALEIYSEDFNLDKLKSQLVFLPTVVSKEKLNSVSNVRKGKSSVFKNQDNNINISNVVKILQNESLTVHAMLDEVKKLIMLILTVPATSVCAERSFSALRRLQMYLRTTMNQKRLTNLSILYVHKSRLDFLDINVLIRKFIEKTAERRSVFALP